MFIDSLERRTFYERMGETMRAAREQRGITREQVAFELNIPVARYVEIERGAAEISMYELYLYMTMIHPDDVSDTWRAE